MSDSLDPMQVLADRMGAAEREELAGQLALFVRRYLRSRGVDVEAGPRTPEEYVRLGVRDALSSEADARTLFLFFACAIAKRIDRELETLPGGASEKFTRPTR